MITNDRGLPDPLVLAVQHQQDQYRNSHGKKSDYSVTQIIKPPRMVELEKRNRDKIKQDASDSIYSLLGSAIHKQIEEAVNAYQRSVSGPVQYETETRLYVELDGCTVSGQFDLYDHYNKTLWDYKVCSVWESVGDIKKDWIHQLNLLAYLCHKNERKVEKLKILAIYRDWSRGRSNNATYPNEQWEVFDIPLWFVNEQEYFLRDRIEKHRAASVELPLCTAEERWERPTQWAVMKKGRKSAIKLHDEEETAAIHIENLDQPGLYIQERLGASVRCSYCSVSEFCEQRAMYETEPEE